jgi:iron complex outermembrane receptor protein
MAALLTLVAAAGFCQQPDTVALGTVTVTATRMNTRDVETPYSLSIAGRTLIQAGQQQISPAEYLAAIPGVYFMDANNFTQDLRVSIRGAGTRSAFGIRGIRLMVDDLPESTPDGQGQIDNLDMGLIDRLEVVRGPASGLYGNAAGGVLSFYTEEAPEQTTVSAKATFGAYGFAQYQLKAAGRFKKTQFVVHGNWVDLSGYRDNSAMRNRLFYGKYRFQINDKTNLTLLVNYANSPLASDAGALTLAEANTGPSKARALNIQYKAGETVEQGRIGAVFSRQAGQHGIFKARLFTTFRTFDNKLAFSDGGIVALDRIFSGGGLSYLYYGKIGSMAYHLHAGADVEDQEDRRKRYANLNGTRGITGLDQLEQFRSAGLFCLNTLSITPKLDLIANIRYDAVRLGLQDHFLSDGNNSDRLTRTNWSPVAGLGYRVVKAINVYANVSTGFETPALSELSANPNGGGGFNPDLQSQHATSMEAGVKGIIQGKFRYEAALYHIDGLNELVQYELTAYPGRSFYRNAGSSIREGVEFDITWMPVKALQVQANFTGAVFEYRQYAVGTSVYDGHSLPGLPKQTGFALLRYTHSNGIFGMLQYRYSGSFYADDANKTNIPAFGVFQLRAGFPFRIGRLHPECFGGINNLTDIRYYDNIRINAAGSRYYEPAPGRNWYAGISIRFP